MSTGHKRAIVQLVQAIGRTSNLITTDFDHTAVHEVHHADFPQQPDGVGVHVSFSISAHALAACPRNTVGECLGL